MVFVGLFPVWKCQGLVGAVTVESEHWDGGRRLVLPVPGAVGHILPIHLSKVSSAPVSPSQYSALPYRWVIKLMCFLSFFSWSTGAGDHHPLPSDGQLLASTASPAPPHRWCWTLQPLGSPVLPAWELGMGKP